MKTYLINFPNESWQESQTRLNRAMAPFVNGLISYSEEWFRTTSFFKKHINIFNEPIGFGLFAWKPFLILESMKKVKLGDIILWCDAGIEPLIDLTHFFSRMDRGVLVFYNGASNKLQTKRLCFKLMNCDERRFWEADQVMGGLNAFKKNEFTIKFLKEWLYYCTQKEVIDDSRGGEKEFKEFIGHRYDQSILSNLVEKYHIRMIMTGPNQGTYMTLEDGTLFINVHRTKKHTLDEKMVLFIKYLVPFFVRKRIPKRWKEKVRKDEAAYIFKKLRILKINNNALERSI